jgi:hypothetical protein
MAYDSNIPDAFPNLYADQWRLGVQQLGSRLESIVNTEIIHGESKRYQKLPSVAARQITTRFGDTNPDDIDVEFRHLYVNFKDSAHILDRREVLQLGSVGSPHSQIMRLQLAAAGRDRDKTLIDALGGTVASGKTGGTPIVLPATSKVGVSFAANDSGFTFEKFIESCRLLGSADVAGQDVENQSPLSLVLSHNQVADMLKETEFTSADYGLQRLMSGEVVNFMGVAIKAVSPALLPYTSATKVRMCYMFARNSVVFGIAENPQAWADELPMKRHDVQLRTEWGWGALRLDEEGVIEIACDEGV